jgi:phosphate transport system protein
MERPFDDELNALKQKLLEMAGHVEEAVALSIQSLKDRNEELAVEVIREEDITNSYDLAVDEICMRLLALRQPVAADLRFIASAMKIGRDLERIGDLTVNIAERTLHLLHLPPLKPLLDIPVMARLAQGMVKDAIDAFIQGDAGLARSVCERDDEVDQLNEQLFRELLTYTITDPGTIPRAIELILIGRNLERIADHATNISEDVIYILKGQIIKHHFDKKPDSRKDGPRKR